MSTNVPATSPLPVPNVRGAATRFFRMTTVISVAAIVMVSAVGARTPPRAAAPQTAPARERTFPIPMSLLQEHALLTTELNAAAGLPGETGAAARRVLRLVSPHFKDEQRRVYPLLNLLPILGAQRVEPWMADLLPVVDRVRRDIDEIREAHGPIASALDDLSTAAWREGHSDYAFLAERIRRHEQMEEEILYPAALVVGDQLRLRLSPPVTASRTQS